MAASAPILFFEGYVDPNAYDDIATADYHAADPNCDVVIKAGFEQLAQIAATGTADDYQTV